MKFNKQKIKDNKYVVDSLTQEKHKLTKIYFYHYYYETQEYWIVAYKMTINSGIDFMIIRKSDMCIIKDSIQDLYKGKKLIKVLEDFI